MRISDWSSDVCSSDLSLYTKFFFDEMGGITAFDEPLAHSGVEALVSVAIDRRIVEAVHCGKAVLEIAAAAHVAPATFAAGRGRGVRHRLDLLEDRIEIGRAHV